MAQHEFSYILRISLIVFLFEIMRIINCDGPLLQDDMVRVCSFQHISVSMVLAVMAQW